MVVWKYEFPCCWAKSIRVEIFSCTFLLVDHLSTPLPTSPLKFCLVKLVMFTEFLAQISSIRNYLHMSVPYWACKLFDLCDLGLS